MIILHCDPAPLLTISGAPPHCPSPPKQKTWLCTCYYLHSPSTASGALYRRSACIDMDVLRLAAAACWDKGWISAQHGVLRDWTVSKTLETCINAEGGHSEHLLWHCLPDIPVATHHNRFFSERPKITHNWLSSERPTFWENATNLQSD